MFINTTKTTLPVFKVAIAWNNEEGFVAINKIIMLCKWMRLNFIFEPVDMAGQNYQKNILYGIDEANLTRLSGTDMLVHTKFDYSYFDKSRHINIEDYIDIAMENYIRTYYVNNEKFNKTTMFFEKNKKYIVNFLNFEKDIYSGFIHDYDFYQSVGTNFTVFCLNKLDDKIILNFMHHMLLFVEFTKMARYFQGTCLEKNFSLDEVITSFKKQNLQDILYVNKEDIVFLPKAEFFEQENVNVISYIDKNVSTINGKFLVKNLVGDIKNGKIKLREGLYLYQIFANEVEVYPNANFWEKTIFNPTIICKQTNEDKIMTL